MKCIAKRYNVITIIPIVAKRIAEFRYDRDHQEIREVVMEAAREYQCNPTSIRLQGIEYPDVIEW